MSSPPEAFGADVVLRVQDGVLKALLVNGIDIPWVSTAQVVGAAGALLTLNVAIFAKTVRTETLPSALSEQSKKETPKTEGKKGPTNGASPHSWP